MSFKEYILSNSLGEIIEDSSFKELTTIKTGGNIKLLYIPNSIKSLQKAYKFICDNELSYFIIGNGSNVLAGDKDYNGIVILVKRLPYYIIYNEDSTIISAFYPTSKLSYDLAKKGLGDLSFLAGIPGLIGGAIYNNSGAYGKSIGDDVIGVSYIDSNGEIKYLSQALCAFGYRRSIFNAIKGIIIEVNIKLIPMDTLDKLEEYSKKRNDAQPINCRSMGSIFKNNPLIESWRIIDALGLRGYKNGGAQISDKHTNFIINADNATSTDIIEIIELIETRAKLEFGIKMIREITIL